MKVQRLLKMAVTASTMLVVGVFLARCSSSSNTSNSTSGTTPYIYIASGNAYAGNGTVMLTPSNTIAKFNAADGSFNSLLVDYTLNTGDTPVALTNYDNNSFLVLVDNTVNFGYRRIDRVYKDGSGLVTFLQNGTAFGSTAPLNPLTSISLAGDGGYLVGLRNTTANTVFVEKFNSTKVRITSGANPFVNSGMASPCNLTAVAGERYSTVVVAPTTNNIIVAAPNATPNNKVMMINPLGYSVAGDCYSAPAMPTTTHLPTAMVMHSSGKLLVGFANTTGTAVNQIYSYDVSATAISNATQLYNVPSVVQGISAMAEKMDDSNVLVANGVSTYNTVERFTFSNNTLTRVGSTPYITPSIYTRSISGIIAPVAN